MRRVKEREKKSLAWCVMPGLVARCLGMVRGSSTLVVTRQGMGSASHAARVSGSWQERPWTSGENLGVVCALERRLVSRDPNPSVEVYPPPSSSPFLFFSSCAAAPHSRPPLHADDARNQGWFFLDLVATVPWDLLVLNIAAVNSSAAT